MNEFGYIYKITNTINGKVYIGKAKNPKQRWINHKHKHKTSTAILGKAMRKYGFENFKFQILQKVDLSILGDVEILAIEAYNSIICGYNMYLGYNKTTNYARSRCGRKSKEPSHKRTVYSYNFRSNELIKHETIQALSLMMKEEYSACYAAAIKGQPLNDYILFFDKDEINNTIKGRNFPVISINLKTNERKVFNNVANTAKELNLPKYSVYSGLINGYTINDLYKFERLDINKIKDSICQ